MFQEIGKGEKKKYFGALCAISADNLASLALGGFKEAVQLTECADSAWQQRIQPKLR